MMITINYNQGIKKCRVWLNVTPLPEPLSSHITRSTVAASLSQRRENQKIAIELFITERYYAFLCADYTYEVTDMLEINVYSQENTKENVADTIALDCDEVYIGILEYFNQAILNSACQVAQAIHGVPSGVLKFTTGAHSIYGSSEVIFAKVTGILIRLLAANLKETETAEIEELVRSEIDKGIGVL